MKKSHKLIIQIALLGTSFFLCYWFTLKGMVHIWLTKGDYSHAFLIPPIVLYFVWERRNSLKRTEIKPYWLGLIPMVFIFLGVVYGILGSSPTAVRLSIPLILLTLTLLCYGKDVAKVMLFPLLFLFFILPVPANLQARLTWSLKLISSKIALALLYVSGISAHGEGNIIDIGYTQLQVVDACSGLRYIFPLMALGVIYAYFFQKKAWKRIVLVVSTIPMAVLMNSTRIAVTGILSEKWSPKVAEGFFHGFSGWLIFLFALACLFIINFLLNIVTREGKTVKSEIGSGEVGSEGGGSSQVGSGEMVRNNGAVLLSATMLLGVFLLSLSVGAMPRVTLARGIEEFPLVINDWHGQKNYVDPEMVEKSGAEESFEASYINNAGELVNLYMGYRGSAFLESEMFFHSPDICLPSSGWNILTKTPHLIDMRPYFSKFKVKKLMTEKLDGKSLVYYWFQTNKRIAYDVDLNRFHLTLHAMLRDNTPDVFVRVTTPIQRDETISSAEKRLDGFVKEMEPTLIEFLRNTKEDRY